MGEKALVESLVNDAVVLIRKLDELGISPTSAVWFYYEDADEWRLLIASPALDQFLPKQEAVAYEKLIEAFSNTSTTTIRISDLKLVRTDYPLLKALRVMAHTHAKGIVRLHFTDCTVDQVFVKEAVILRAA